MNEHTAGNTPEIRYASDKPYPKIKVERQNLSYARAMLDNMGGRNSEMNAVSLYIYNSLIAENEPTLSEPFQKISIVEMHHLKMFGQLAYSLGENPRLWSVQGNGKVYWSPGYNHYPTQLKPLLLNAIQHEQEAIQQYEKQTRWIYDECICAILKRIILDEEIHLKIYKNLYDTYIC